MEEGLRDRDSERASGAGRLIVETSAGLHCRQDPQLRRCGQERKNRYCSSVEGNLVMNKGELQYYDYSIAVSSTSLLALMHVPNLVAAPVWFVQHMYGASYADINKYVNKLLPPRLISVLFTNSKRVMLFGPKIFPHLLSLKWVASYFSNYKAPLPLT